MTLKLDKYQRKVVAYEVPDDGALRVIANAGAGKSTTMLHKVKALIDEGERPNSIVVISFSRKSRQDLERKWKKEHEGDSPYISTIHSLGLMIIKKYLKIKNFKLMKPYEQLRLVKTLIESSGVKYNDLKTELFAVLNEISYCKAENISIEDLRGVVPEKSESKAKSKSKTSQYTAAPRAYTQSLGHDTFISIFDAYEKYKEEHSYFDFDDLVSKTYSLLLDNPEVLAKIRSKLKIYIVDESQDLNKANWDLVMLLSSGLKLIAVGDLCQNIYRFRYARPEFFSQDFFSLNFETVKDLQLPFNYRSCKEIVEFGNVIRDLANDPLVAKPVKPASKGALKFFTEKKSNLEGKLVVRLVKELNRNGYKNSDITVICRSTNFINTVVEKALIENNINYEILAGNSVNFHDSNSVKLFMAMIAMIVDPKNMVAYTSTIPFLSGMGEFKLQRGGFEKLGKTAETYIKLILKLGRPNVSVGRHDTFLNNFYSEVIGHRVYVKQGEPFEEVLDSLYDMHFKYVKEANRVTKSQYGRIRGTVMNFVNDYFSKNKTKKLKDALQDLLLNVDSYDPDEKGKDDRLTLSTVHAQKGLESKVTIACGFRSFSKPEDLGDDLNILYVQLSRAIEKLIVIRSECLRRANNHVVPGVENPHLVDATETWEESKELGIGFKPAIEIEKESSPW